MADDTRRRTTGRFGMKTNKTLKYNRDEVWSRRRDADGIVVLENGELPQDRWDTPLGVSINARKNWEVIENNNGNSLHRSQDEFRFNTRILDVDVSYGPRIVVVENNATLTKACRREKYRHTLRGPNNSAENQTEEEESKKFNGENRKGFFVKEKRKKGKKGVLKTQERERLRSKSFNSRFSQSESDSDSAIDEEEKDKTIIIACIKPKHPDFVRRPPKPGCDCTICTGIEKNHQVNKRRQVVKDISAL